jgi:glycosyltransferase involved in cell wall biosynthesis
MTDPLGQSQVLPYLCGLSAKGAEITLISAEKSVNFEKTKGVVTPIIEAANINWRPVNYTAKPPIVSTIKDIRKIKKKALQLHQEHAFDIVHCRSYISALIGLHFKRKLGVKFIFDMRGFYADERVDGKIWNLKNPAYKRVYTYFKKKELEFLHHADHIISLTENAKHEMLSWKPNQGKNLHFTVIPCCTDLKLFNSNSIKASDQDELRKTYHLKPDDFVISYLGSIGTWYMLDEMMAFFSELLQKHPTAKFVFITNDSKELIYTAATKFNVPEERIAIKGAPRALVPAALSLSKLAIFFIKPVFSKKASCPTKLGEIMGLGIPTICNSNVGDVDGVIEKYNAGILIHEFNSNSYQEAIAKIEETLNSDRSKLVAGANEYFSLEKGVEKYFGIYQSLSH